MRRGSWRTGAGSTLGLAMLLPLLQAAPVRAQQVQGIVLDELSHAPVKGADVSLLGTRGKVVGRELTDSTGRFALTLPRFGAYAVKVDALGYTPFLTHLFVADTSQEISAQVNLAPAPLALKGLNVTTTAIQRELQEVGFYRRKKEGFGYYIMPNDIEEKLTDKFTDVFYGIPGVKVKAVGSGGYLWDITMPTSRSYCTGAGSSSGGGGANMVNCNMATCYPSIYLDGNMIRHGGNGAIAQESAGDWTQLFSPYDVAAIEVYPNPAGMPAFASGSDSPCGAVLIWTKSH